MSIIHVTGGKGGGKPVDRTNFIGHKVPEETKVMIKHLKKLDKPTFRNFLKGRLNPIFKKKKKKRHYRGDYLGYC